MPICISCVNKLGLYAPPSKYMLGGSFKGHSCSHVSSRMQATSEELRPAPPPQGAQKDVGVWPGA